MESLDGLTNNYQVMLIKGPSNEIDIPLRGKNYCIVSYLKEEMPDCLSMADLIISRAGANTLFEILSLKKPSLLIPLTTKSSRGDQFDNARNFEQHGFSIVLDQTALTPDKLQDTIAIALCNIEFMIKEMEQWEEPDTISLLINLFEELV